MHINSDDLSADIKPLYTDSCLDFPPAIIVIGLEELIDSISLLYLSQSSSIKTIIIEFINSDSKKGLIVTKNSGRLSKILVCFFPPNRVPLPALGIMAVILILSSQIIL
tara:strand:- start:224 stop:550 length:327 start_codon:yes stop_codon:yes gene_type:complete